MELFNKSGSHTSDFRTYNKGDSILHCMFVMYKDNAMLMSLADKKIDGGAGVQSAVATAALPAAAPVGPVVAVRANTLAKRMGRERNESLALMAESSASMAESSRRRAAATIVRELTSSLSDARKAGAADAVIDALEQQLLDCISECSVRRSSKRARDGAEIEVAKQGGGTLPVVDNGTAAADRVASPGDTDEDGSAVGLPPLGDDESPHGGGVGAGAVLSSLVDDFSLDGVHEGGRA